MPDYLEIALGVLKEDETLAKQVRDTHFNDIGVGKYHLDLF